MILLENELGRNIQQAINKPVEQIAIVAFGEPYAVAHSPVDRQAAWAGVSGADTVEVSGGRVVVGAPVVEEKTLSGLSVSKSGNHHTVVLGQTARVVSLTLSGFTYRPVGGTQDLPFAAGPTARLIVAIPNPELQWVPLYAVPHVSTGTSPKQYAGAWLDGLTLKLPADVPAVDRLRLSVVQNFPGKDETVLASTITGASARIRNLPIDLEVRNETEGSVLFTHKGLFLNETPDVTIDLIAPAQAAFERQLAAGEPLSLRWRLSSKSGTAFHHDSRPVAGALLRRFTGATTAELAGEPLPLPLDLQAAPLAAERASTATADLRLTYQGLRLVERLNDPLPAGSGSLAGRIVGEAPAGRLLLDPELAAYPIHRIGLLGRAPEPCELSLWLAPPVGDLPGEPLGDPGVVQVQPATGMGVIWIDLPRPRTFEGPLWLQVRANTGRFFWLGEPEPLVRVVVEDEEPANRPVHLNGTPLRTMAQAELAETAVSLNADHFRSSPPVLSSHLFVTVSLTDLTLRYSR